MKKLNKISSHLHFCTFHIFLILFLSLITFSFSSCGKDDPEPDLVPITMTGENTMGFYVDGVPCNIEGKGNWTFPKGVDYFLFIEKNVQISGNFGSDQTIKYLSIKFQIDSLNPLKKYILKSEGKGLALDNQPLGGREYITDSVNVGEVNILKFSEAIISGTFQFNAINLESGKIIKITDGRFDIKR